MTIAEWNIVLNALIAVLLLFYGLWFRNVVNQQLKSKDATIESLAAAIKANEAEISRLQGESAPAITDAYMRLRDFSNEMAKKVQDQSTELEKERSINEKRGDCSPAQRLTEKSNGFREASRILASAIKDLQTVGAPKGGVTAHEFLNAITRVVSAMDAWITANGAALKAARLEESNSK